MELASWPPKCSVIAERVYRVRTSELGRWREADLQDLSIDMKYMVRCFSKGRLGGNEPREVEAESAHQAAETLCGGPLEYAGRFSELRAEVWPINKPASKLLLYRSPAPH